MIKRKKGNLVKTSDLQKSEKGDLRELNGMKTIEMKPGKRAYLGFYSKKNRTGKGERETRKSSAPAQKEQGWRFSTELSKKEKE